MIRSTLQIDFNITIIPTVGLVDNLDQAKGRDTKLESKWSNLLIQNKELLVGK